MGNSNFTDNPTKSRILTPSRILQPGGSGDVRNLSPNYWFGPGQPVKPSAPAGTKPRRYAYTPLTNYNWTPKGEEGIDFPILRQLADAWGLLRIIIETQKDRLCAKKFEVRAKPKPGESNKDRKERNLEDPNVKALNAFLDYPDGEHTFSQWLRITLEEMIVLDAVPNYLQRDTAGKIANIITLDGATINRQLTEEGMTPPSPSVAYQQVLYGTVSCNFTTDDMLYTMRNERANWKYGFSPVQQILVTLSIALRREQFQLEYYTSGNVPEALCFLPSDLPIDRVKEAQDWYDSIMAGDLGNRRRMRFLPGYGSSTNAKPNVIFPKEPLLKDEMDEWLAKLACYCIGVSPQPFIKQMNRASAEQAQDTSEAEGQEPYLVAIENMLNQLIQLKMGYMDYEVVRPQQAELDQLKAAQTDDIIVGKIYTINEIRERRGEDKREEPEADELGSFTATGFVPLGGTEELTEGEDDPDDNPEDASSSKKKKKKPSKTNTKAIAVVAAPAISPASKPNGIVQHHAAGFLPVTSVAPIGRVGSITFEKASIKEAKFQHGSLTLVSAAARDRLANTIEKRFVAMKAIAVLHLSNKFIKASENDDLVKQIMDDLLPELEALAEQSVEEIQAAIDQGIQEGLLQVELTDSSLLSEVNSVAQSWARDRAAELVGMQWAEDGSLEENANAEMAISDTTREQIAEIVTEAFETPFISKKEIAQRIADSGIFSKERAMTIARTEVARAQTEGNLELWKQSGVVKSVKWFTSEDEGVCAECDQNDGEVRNLGEEFPSGAESPSDTHPNCRCILAVAEIEEE